VTFTEAGHTYEAGDDEHDTPLSFYEPIARAVGGFDLNESESVAYIYEVETNCTRERRREKAMQYTDDAECSVIADCMVVDPTEAPDSLDSLEEWVKDQLF